MKHFVPVLLLGCSALASAQVGVYGRTPYLHDHDAVADTSANYFGVGLGVYDDLVHLGPVRAGLDLRADYLFASQGRYRDLLAGIRLAVRVPVIGFTPYVQGSLGPAGTAYTGSRAQGVQTGGYNTKLLYGVFAGADVRLLPHFDFRAIEVGYLRRSGTNGSANNNPAETLIVISSGIVVRF